MIILLPPSESKTPATRGEPLDLSALAFPALTAQREKMVATLARVSGQKNRLVRLGLGPGQEAEVARNTALMSSPAGRAIDTYTGVLYGALDVATVAHPKRLDRVFVASALFGVVRATDRIPAYRLSMSTPLLKTPLATVWKRHLAEVLSEQWAAEVILDCRSTDYRRAWPGVAEHTVTVSVVTVRDGRRTVVSHNAKHTRGLVVRHLLNRKVELPEDIDGLVAAVSEAFDVEFTPPTRTAPGVLTVLLHG